MSLQAGLKTTRSGRPIKDSDKKKRMQETEAMETPDPVLKHKRNGSNKENQGTSKHKPEEFKFTQLTTNSTSLKGTTINLQARKSGLPRPSATPTPKPAQKVAGKRRAEPSPPLAIPQPSSRKLTPAKAALLAAARNPYGVVPSGQNGVSPASPQQSRRASAQYVPSSTAAGLSRTRQTHLQDSSHEDSVQGKWFSANLVTAPQPSNIPLAVKPDSQHMRQKFDRATNYDHEEDNNAPYRAHYRVSEIHLQGLDNDDSFEDEEAGIPREFWIPSRLRELAKNARVLLNFDRTEGQDDGASGLEHSEGSSDHALEHHELYDIPEESDTENHGDNDEMANMLEEDEHDGEFDDAPEVEEEDYDSDTPLAKRRHVRGHADADPHSAYPKASRIRDRVEGKQPRIADYEPDARHILVQAIRIFKSLVSTDNAYPDKLTELTWAKQAWWQAADELDVELAPNRECVKIITAYSWHLRGEMKTAARNLVETAYRFRPSGQTAIQLRNRERAAALRKGDAFVYYKRGKTEDEHQGLYQADIIQQMVNRIYFKNKKDDGIVLKNKYSPFPTVALALVLAAVECAIEEWSDGSFTKVPFTEEKYAPIYRHHLRELRQYEAVSDDLQVVTQICQWIYEDGRIYAKAGPDETLVTRSLGAKVHAKALVDFKRSGGRYDRAGSDDGIDENE